MAQSDVARLTERVTALVEQGLDVAEAYAAAKGNGSKLTREHAKAMEKHAKSVRKHGQRVAALRQRSVTMTAVSGATAVLGVIDVAAAPAAGIPFEPWMWLGVSAVAAVSAVRSRYAAQHAVAPEPPALAASASANDLRRDAIGWAEAQGLAAVRRQLVGMVPAVASLHPDAARELTAADDEAAPALAAQVARLAVLDQVRRELPGSAAAESAGDAAQLVRARLAEGVAVYDRLLAAASTMLASPDLGRSSLDVLGPAADALTAYAAGLRVASGEQP
ncbi:MAG: hypothetical protein U0S36_06150 [Candidatus Nanopelagicales bacterium]